MQENKAEQNTEDTIFPETGIKPGGYDKHIRYARILLYVIAGIQIMSLFILPAMEGLELYITVGLGISVAIAFVVLAIWSIKNPYSALLTALILYVAIILLNTALDPSSIVKGIAIKVISILLLINGYRNAKEDRAWQKTYGM